jgi:hypothetical protein
MSLREHNFFTDEFHYEPKLRKGSVDPVQDFSLFFGIPLLVVDDLLFLGGGAWGNARRHITAEEAGCAVASLDGKERPRWVREENW